MEERFRELWEGGGGACEFRESRRKGLWEGHRCLDTEM